MDLMDAVLYFVLIIILIALVSVLSWIVYDYYNYKEEQQTINSSNTNKFKDTSSADEQLKIEINKLHINNSNYIGNTSNYLINYTDKTITSNIRYTSNYIDTNIIRTNNYIDNNNIYTSNYIRSGNNKINDNLKRYFNFSDIPNDKSFYDYFLSGTTDNEEVRLNLINETTASSGLRVNTSIENDKYFQICNTSGDNCYKLFVDSDNSLVAQYGTNIATKKQIAKPIVDLVTPTTLPTVATPTVATPIVATPTVATPIVATPTVARPIVATPTVARPTVATPTVATPTVATPIVATPTVARSTVATPTVTTR